MLIWYNLYNYVNMCIYKVGSFGGYQVIIHSKLTTEVFSSSATIWQVTRLSVSHQRQQKGQQTYGLTRGSIEI